MRRLPVVAALLAIPASAGEEIGRESDASPDTTAEAAPAFGYDAMESPAFGHAAHAVEVLADPVVQSPPPVRTAFVPAPPRPAPLQPKASVLPAASVAPQADELAPFEAEQAAAPVLALASADEPEAVLWRAALTVPASDGPPIRSDMDEPSIPALAAEQPPRLAYDTGGLVGDTAEPLAQPLPPSPVLAYDTSGLDEARSGEEERSADRPAVLAAAPQSAPPAIAYPETGSEKSVFDGDFLIVAAGAVSLPSYEGSNDRRVIPAAAIAGSIAGVGLSPRAGGLALDFVPDKPGARVGLSLGPVAKIRTNRTGDPRDPVVARLRKLDTIIEAGVAAGVTVRRVLNPHDRLSFGIDMRWDISGRGSGYVVAPSASYLTPLSRAMVAGLLVGAEFADGSYAHYNYDVSPAEAVVSGLPAFSAKGGFKAANLGLFVARDLNANLLDGGLAIGVGGMYSHLYGSAAATPITTIRGSRSQWIFGGGLGYVF